MKAFYAKNKKVILIAGVIAAVGLTYWYFKIYKKKGVVNPMDSKPVTPGYVGIVKKIESPNTSGKYQLVKTFSNNGKTVTAGTIVSGKISGNSILTDQGILIPYAEYLNNYPSNK